MAPISRSSSLIGQENAIFGLGNGCSDLCENFSSIGPGSFIWQPSFVVAFDFFYHSVISIGLFFDPSPALF